MKTIVSVLVTMISATAFAKVNYKCDTPAGVSPIATVKVINRDGNFSSEISIKNNQQEVAKILNVNQHLVCEDEDGAEWMDCGDKGAQVGTIYYHAKESSNNKITFQLGLTVHVKESEKLLLFLFVPEVAPRAILLNCEQY